MKSQLRGLGIIVGVAVLATVGMTFLIEANKASFSSIGGLEAGQQAPLKLEAAGWLNGKPPTESELNGKVVVVHAWFYN